jgi:mannose-6-phosphate isomerase-like protein (cupin superfamily)
MSAGKDPKTAEVEGLRHSGNPQVVAKSFSFHGPEALGAKRSIVPLARSDIMIAMIQIFQRGGEQDLHSHTALDGFWFVLSGRARFHGEGDILIGDLCRHEGVFIPRNFFYWFESVGDDPLEILQVEAIDKAVVNSVSRPGPPPETCADVLTPTGEMIARNVPRAKIVAAICSDDDDSDSATPGVAPTQAS